MYTLSQKLKINQFKQRLKVFALIWILILSLAPVAVTATDPDTGGSSNTSTNADSKTGPFKSEPVTQSSNTSVNTGGSDTVSKDSGQNTLASIFSTDVWSGTNLQSGLAIAKPFVRVIMVIAVGVVCIISYMFFMTTALDLAYITVPMVRPLLMKGKEKSEMGGGNGGGLKTISDAAVEAVNGRSGGGGLGGGGDRGTGSCLVTYISSRTGEFVAFILFIMMFFTGVLGKIVVVLFNLLYSILEGIMSIA
jgi:hypothetical protein